MSEKERVHFKIALPVDLKQRMEHEAVENRRSLSAEIIARLEQSFDIVKIASDEMRLRERFVKVIERQEDIMTKQSELLDDLLKELASKEADNK